MHPVRKAVIGGAFTAAALTGGAIGASFFGVSTAATTSTTPASSSTSSSTAGQAQLPPAFPAHGTTEHESQEKAVTGDAATKAQAAAVKSVGSGTAGSVTTDFTGNGYEVTVTKADGSQVEVHLDSSFNVMPRGGPNGGPGRPNDNDADDAPAASTAG